MLTLVAGPILVSVAVVGANRIRPIVRFWFQVSGFRFQVCYYPTFLSAWEAVLSAAMVARDAVSGKW